MSARQLSAAAAALVSVLAAAGRSQACDFCNPGDVTVTMGMRNADSTVKADVVAKRFVFRGDGAAQSAVKFKVAGHIRGDRPETGTVFEALLEPKRLGTAGKAVLNLTVVGKTVTVLDAYPDQEGRLAAYLAQGATLSENDAAAVVGFYSQHLEDADAVISSDAQSQFGAMPYAKVREGAAALPADKLREWLASDKVVVSRKGGYGLMLGLCGKAEDAEILRKALGGVGDNYTAAGGLLAGLCLLTEKPAEVLGPVIADTARPMAVRKAALNVCRFLLEKNDPKFKPAVLDLFRKGLADKRTAEFAVEEMARAYEFSLADDVKALWLDKARSTHNVRVFVRFYGAVMPDDAKRKAFLNWLEANPAPQPPAED